MTFYEMSLENKNILIGVTGGIAIYKTLDLIRKLRKESANVKVIMTKNAMKFINPVMFSTISNNKIYTDMFDYDNEIEHIELSDWADYLITAPATANIIGKIANGIADDLLSTVYLSFSKKKSIVPSMNVNMFNNRIVRQNINKLRENGIKILEPETGELACGVKGKGRLPLVGKICHFIKRHIFQKTEFSGKKVLVTSGPTYEFLDTIRFFSNISSGKQGYALAEAFDIAGCEVTLITSKKYNDIPDTINIIEIISAEDMYKKVMKIVDKFDIIIFNAAVADFTPSEYIDHKIKKENKESLKLEMKKTKDILKEVCTQKKENQFIIGFAAEDNIDGNNIKTKFVNKNCDIMVANKISDSFGKDVNSVKIFYKDSRPPVEIKNQSKQAIAFGLLKHVLNI